MGGEAAETLEVSTEDAPAVEVEPTEPETPKENGEDGDEGEKEPVEFEVIRSGKDGSQPDTQHGIRKRINKLNGKVDVAEGAASEAQAALNMEREKNKLLQLALEQKAPAEALMPPDPDDFDDGVRDPKYLQAFNDFNQPLIAAEVQRQTANLVQPKPEVDPGLERMQTKHVERARELGAKDFDEVEDKAIDILGKDTVNHLINNSDKSHLVLYYLGKNPDKAEQIAELVKTNPIKATLQLGRLEVELSVKPQANLEPTPDPDDELQGGNPSAGATNKFQRELDKARVKAQDGGADGMKAILDIKKRAKEAGASVT